LGEFLEAKMHDPNLTQDAFASEIHIEQGQISKWLKLQNYIFSSFDEISRPFVIDGQSNSHPKFIDMENRLLEAFRVRRKAGRKVLI
jgi:hypothetical protein